MKISYNKLWKLLIDNNMQKTDLIKEVKISSNVLARMGKNEPISMESLEKICQYFSVNIGDIVEFTEE